MDERRASGGASTSHDLVRLDVGAEADDELGVAVEQLLVHSIRRYSVAGVDKPTSSRTRRSSSGSGFGTSSGSSRERHHTRRRRRRRRDYRGPGCAIPDLQRHEDGRCCRCASSRARWRGRARLGAEASRPHERRARLRLAAWVPRGGAGATGIRMGRRRVPRPCGRGGAAVRAREGLGVLEHGLPAAAAAPRRARRARAIPAADSASRPRRSPSGSATSASPFPRRAHCCWTASTTSAAFTTRAGSGHRTLVARAGDLVGFWRDLPAEMLDPRTFVPVGADAPGFVRPSYGLGVMADPGQPARGDRGPRRRWPRLCDGRLRSPGGRRRRDRLRGRRALPGAAGRARVTRGCTPPEVALAAPPFIRRGS